MGGNEAWYPIRLSKYKEFLLSSLFWDTLLEAFHQDEVQADGWKWSDQQQRDCGCLWHGWDQRGSHQDLSFWPNTLLPPHKSWSLFHVFLIAIIIIIPPFLMLRSLEGTTKTYRSDPTPCQSWSLFHIFNIAITSQNKSRYYEPNFIPSNNLGWAQYFGNPHLNSGFATLSWTNVEFWALPK